MKFGKRIYHLLEVDQSFDGSIFFSVHNQGDASYAYVTRKEAKRIRKGLKKMLRKKRKEVV